MNVPENKQAARSAATRSALITAARPLFGERGSAHIRSLCKWGPSTFTLRRRVLPSGRPPEDSTTLVQDDPTWRAEYAHFTTLCERGGPTDLGQDLWLQRTLRRLGEQALEVAAP